MQSAFESGVKQCDSGFTGMKNVSDFTMIILCSTAFCARLCSYEGLQPKTHVIATHVRWASRSYLLQVLQTVRIVKSSLIIQQFYWYSFDYGYFSLFNI